MKHWGPYVIVALTLLALATPAFQSGAAAQNCAPASNQASNIAVRQGALRFIAGNSSLRVCSRKQKD